MPPTTQSKLSILLLSICATACADLPSDEASLRAASEVSPTVNCDRADLNGDGVVDDADLDAYADRYDAILAAGRPYDFSSIDVDESGDIVGDLPAILSCRGHHLDSCPASAPTELSSGQVSHRAYDDPYRVEAVCEAELLQLQELVDAKARCNALGGRFHRANPESNLGYMIAGPPSSGGMTGITGQLADCKVRWYCCGAPTDVPVAPNMTAEATEPGDGQAPN